MITPFDRRGEEGAGPCSGETRPSSEGSLSGSRRVCLLRGAPHGRSRRRGEAGLLEGESEVGQRGDVDKGHLELRSPALKERPALPRPPPPSAPLIPIPSPLSGSPPPLPSPHPSPSLLPPFADSGFSCYSNRAASPASESHWRHVHCRIHLSPVLAPAPPRGYPASPPRGYFTSRMSSAPRLWLFPSHMPDQILQAPHPF